MSTQIDEPTTLQACTANWQQAQAEWIAAHPGASEPSSLFNTTCDLEDAVAEFTPPQTQTCKFCGLNPCLCATPEEIAREGLLDLEA